MKNEPNFCHGEPFDKKSGWVVVSMPTVGSGFSANRSSEVRGYHKHPLCEHPLPTIKVAITRSHDPFTPRERKLVQEEMLRALGIKNTGQYVSKFNVLGGFPPETAGGLMGELLLAHVGGSRTVSASRRTRLCSLLANETFLREVGNDFCQTFHAKHVDELLSRANQFFNRFRAISAFVESVKNAELSLDRTFFGRLLEGTSFEVPVGTK